ncbi:MAG TPA: hypothetical protein VFT53_04280 [Candidatus Saccharimonadales bacterium]|nr:hypothetical protein [Candidatus Saccharimonadales bacterium]
MPVLVFAPLRNAAVNSPVVVMVLGDWQTTQLAPFTATLTYGSARTGSGTLVLHNDNPSGLPEKADTVSVPVIF